MELLTTGYACQLYGTTPAKLANLLRKSGAKPAFIINGLEHWRAEDVERAAQRDTTRHIVLEVSEDE